MKIPFLTFVGMFAIPFAAHGQDPTSDPALLGIGVRTRPAYDGSDSRRTEAVPVLRYYGPIAFVRSTRGVLEAGAHYALVPGLNAGVQIAYEEGRKASDSSFLESHGVPDVDVGASYGAHLEWNGMLGPSPVNIIVRGRKHFRSGQGTQADLRLTAGIFQAGRFAAGAVAQAVWSNGKSAETMYGISAQQSLVSALPEFHPGSGFSSASIGLIWQYDIAPHWVAVGNLEVRRVQGDIAKSPLTERRTNPYATIGIAYRF